MRRDVKVSLCLFSTDVWGGEDERAKSFWCGFGMGEGVQCEVV